MLPNNTLAFIALCNEYCAALEGAREAEREPFITTMLRLLPRLYITATDLRPAPEDGEPDPLVEEMDGVYIDNALDEEYYDSLRRAVENLLGEDDTYLETFEEDMKYSDTPIAASISENLADLFQSLYNFLELVRDAPEELIGAAVQAERDDFASFWSRPLCNVLRALNALRHS